MNPFPVTPAHALDEVDEERPWLIQDLWADEAVGIIGGEPKCGLCRARHNPTHAASRVIPRGSEAVDRSTEDPWARLLRSAA